MARTEAAKVHYVDFEAKRRAREYEEHIIEIEETGPFLPVGRPVGFYLVRGFDREESLQAMWGRPPWRSNWSEDVTYRPRNWRLRLALAAAREALDNCGASRYSARVGILADPDWFSKNVVPIWQRGRRNGYPNLVDDLAAHVRIVRALLAQRRRLRKWKDAQMTIDFSTPTREPLLVEPPTALSQMKDELSQMKDEREGDSPRWEHSSESNEHGTPPEIVYPAQDVLGVIDLDPASDELFNQIVEAKKIYTEADDGLAQRWFGNVFLNPPGGLLDEDRRRVIVKTKKRRGCSETGSCGLPPGKKHKHKGVESSAAIWWRKLISSPDVVAAIWVGFSLEQLQVLQGLEEDGRALVSPLDFPTCFLKSRADYNKPVDGKLVRGGAPPHSSYVTLYVRAMHEGPHERQRAYRYLVERFCASFGPLGKVVNRD